MELAGDLSTTFDTVKHTIEQVEKYDHIIILQPTSPLRDESHIDKAIEIFLEKKSDAVVSVCIMDHSPLWSGVLPEDDNLESFLDCSNLKKRSQDLEVYYRLNGAIYIYQLDFYLRTGGIFFNKKTYAYKMKKNVSIDIDNKFDFKIAEMLMRSKEK